MTIGSDLGPSWHQVGPSNASSTLGKVYPGPLTFAASQGTVGAASGTLVAADASNTRKVILFVPSTADTGITINFGAAAVVATHFFIPSGASLEIDTVNEIRAIRNGAADVTVYIMLGTA